MGQLLGKDDRNYNFPPERGKEEKKWILSQTKFWGNASLFHKDTPSLTPVEGLVMSLMGSQIKGVLRVSTAEIFFSLVNKVVNHIAIVNSLFRMIVLFRVLAAPWTLLRGSPH